MGIVLCMCMVCVYVCACGVRVCLLEVLMYCKYFEYINISWFLRSIGHP